MPLVGLFAYDFDAVISPVIQEFQYSFIPRIGDFVHLTNPRGGSSVYEVFAVVVNIEGCPHAADVHAKQVSEEKTPAESYIASKLGLNRYYPPGPEPTRTEN